MAITFRKAVKQEKKLRLAICGPSGSGKTYTSLAMAKELSEACGQRFAVIDTENGSSTIYSDEFDFDVLDIGAPFHPMKYVEAIKEAEKQGYSVVVIDSLSHAWSGPGGLLEEKEKLSKTRGYNDYTAWGPVGKIQNSLIQKITSSSVHVIVTMRSKTKHIIEEYITQGKTKSRPKKVGMEPIQREGVEYEFDLVFEMNLENEAIIEKTRCRQLSGEVIKHPGKELAHTIYDWLQGAPPERSLEDRKEEARKKAIEDLNSIAAKHPKGDEFLAKVLEQIGCKDISHITSKQFGDARPKLLILVQTPPEPQKTEVQKKLEVKGVPKEEAQKVASTKMKLENNLRMVLEEVKKLPDGEKVSRDAMAFLLDECDSENDHRLIGIIENSFKEEDYFSKKQFEKYALNILKQQSEKSSE